MSTPSLLLALILWIHAAVINASPPRTHHPRRQDSICGHANHVGIHHPKSGSTVVISQDDQDSDSTTVEVIFCSDAYFETSSVNLTTWLSYADNPDYGVLLASGVEPDSDVADGGFYGYRFNVSFGPIDDGDWDVEDERMLFVQETQTGLYYAYGIELWSVNFSLALAPAYTSTVSSAATSVTSTGMGGGYNTTTFATSPVTTHHSHSSDSGKEHSSTDSSVSSASDGCGAPATASPPPAYPTYGK